MKHLKVSMAFIAAIAGFSVSALAADLDENRASLLCPTALNVPERPIVEAVLEPDDTYMTADDADLIEKGVSTLTGDAEITRNLQQVRADKIVYDEPADTADLDGNVNYWDEALFLESKEAFLTFDNGIGEFDTANYILYDSRGRGQADKLIVDAGTSTEMQRLRYTTCDPDDEFWSFTAKKLFLDHEKNQGTARNVVLRIKDFPVFYTPYMSFPLSKERKSGFLAPSYGTTARQGFETRTPYYWNISPNMDATLTPRLMTDTGVMAIGEFRYLFENSSGEIHAEYLPSDNQRQDDHRNLFGLTHNQRFGSNNQGNLFLTFNRVSDQFYFEDFGTQLSTTSTQFLERRADVSYSANGWSLATRVQDFQTVDPSIPVTSRPYKRLPQLLLNYRSPREYGSLNYGLETETVYFERGDDVIFAADNDNINGLRLHVEPFISFPMRTTASFLEPRLAFDYTQYNLDDSAQFSKSPSRALPKFSLDGGLFFERETSLFGSNVIQTLEPRMYYLYVPRDDQSDLPVFDTGLIDFSFAQLFRDNRFNGNDRQSDANQLTLAVTSNFISSDTGRELASVSLGQIFFLRDRKVTLPNNVGFRDEASSAIVAEANTKIFRNWNIGGDIIWDPNIGNSTDKITMRATYNPEPGKILNLAYRVRRDITDIEQSDVSLRWPITQNWSAVGRWNYAVPEGRSLEVFGGIEYESCCWAMRAVARRFLTNINGDFETGVFLQMQLKGLGGIGQRTVEFLRQQIPGYESDF